MRAKSAFEHETTLDRQTGLRWFVFTCEPWASEIYVIYGERLRSNVNKLAKRLFGLEDFDSGDYAFTHELCEQGRNDVCIYLTSSTDMYTVMHECFHATQIILQNVGVPFEDDSNNEAWAYTMENLTRHIWTSLVVDKRTQK